MLKSARPLEDKRVRGWERDIGTWGRRKLRLEIFHREELISREFSLSVNFLTLFISRRGAKIHSVVIIYYRIAVLVEGCKVFQEGGEQ